MTTEESILQLYNSSPLRFILESQPTYGIYALCTIKYGRGKKVGLEPISLPCTMHQIIFPFCCGYETTIYEDTVNLSKVRMKYQ